MERSNTSIGMKITVFWLLLMLALLLVTGFFGFVMRVQQAGLMQLVSPKSFYTILTAHGLVNVLVFFVAAFMLSRFLIGRYVDTSNRVTLIASALVLIGLLGVLLTVLLGEMSVGWYFLYPIIFYESEMGYRVAWELSILLLGVGLILMALYNIRAAVKRYGFKRSFGWHYIAGIDGPEVPPVVLINFVASIVTVAATIAGAILILSFIAQDLGYISYIDPLEAKNLTFMFGHCIANLTMFFTISAVYEIMPFYSKKPWKTNWMIALAWNISGIAVVYAMFHHLYMDFVQALQFQFLGTLFSYIASIPALVVTIIGAFSQLMSHRAQEKAFSMVPAFIFAGIIAWVVGSAAAVVDATIPANFLFHNTYWVPAHFHTYFGYGVSVMLIGLLWSLIEARSSILSRRTWMLLLAVITIGWVFHLASFYIGGTLGVPRRYFSYTALPEFVAQAGNMLASLSALGAVIVAVGYIPLLYYTTRYSLKLLKGG